MGNVINDDGNQIDVNMEDLVRFYLGGFGCRANSFSYGATSSISKGTSSVMLVIAARGD